LNARRAVVTLSLVAISTACMSILGLESGSFESFEGSVCDTYRRVCPIDREIFPGAGAFGIPGTCERIVSGRLNTPATDPSHPNVQTYADRHCREKTTCAEFLDCLSDSNVIPTINLCGTPDCLGDPIEAGPRPWRCCSGDSCVAVEGGTCLPSNFGCTGNVQFAKPDGVTNYMVTVSFHDINSMKPVTNLEVKSCNKLDPDCTGGTMPLSSGGGVFTFSLPRAFDGFLQVRDLSQVDAGDEYISLLVFIYPPLDVGGVSGMGDGGIPLFQRKAYTAIANQFGQPVDRDAGQLFTFAIDCNQRPSEGVTAKLDVDASQQLYFTGMVPSPMATMTDKAGQIGWVNVPAGLRVVKTNVRGVQVGSTPVFVRPDTLSFTSLPPTP
jgi:hypothetical protein